VAELCCALVHRLVRRSPLINPFGTKTEALATAESASKKVEYFRIFLNVSTQNLNIFEYF